ncbi:hypothetical protein F511_07714 [Dorcoceras hygrometricum]|uniref:Uncharacterized protein n=1 Tax=Dorcoceras hygrometricum TaxID=472368 RepID=A0A2Z7CJM0_9LAMI|nr:hypothetical protein F511_07714 [Dorcoceras hygrometricum]
MLVVSSPGIKFPALGVGYPQVSMLSSNFNGCIFSKFHTGAELVSRGNSSLVRTFLQSHGRTRILAARGDYQPSYNDDANMEPFWVNPLREAIWGIQSLLVFLVEQPSQLRYIEWPSFQRTLKTATLTLVLVALLIVALDSVDSALSYLLAFLLRRKA